MNRNRAPNKKDERERKNENEEAKERRSTNRKWGRSIRKVQSTYLQLFFLPIVSAQRKRDRKSLSVYFWSLMWWHPTPLAGKYRIPAPCTVTNTKRAHTSTFNGIQIIRLCNLFFLPSDGFYFLLFSTQEFQIQLNFLLFYFIFTRALLRIPRQLSIYLISLALWIVSFFFSFFASLPVCCLLVAVVVVWSSFLEHRLGLASFALSFSHCNKYFFSPPPFAFAAFHVAFAHPSSSSPCSHVFRVHCLAGTTEKSFNDKIAM